MPQKKALVLYWSKNGNTKKVAERIHAALKNGGLQSELTVITESLKLAYLDYNLLFIGAPVYSNLFPEEAVKFLQNQKQRGVAILPCAPEQPGIGAVVFCTYGGGHTGINEAVPALKFAGQFLEHEGIRVIEEWAFLGSFPEADKAYNTAGRFGVIQNRPNDQDLQEVEGRVKGLLQRMKLVLPI